MTIPNAFVSLVRYELAPLHPPIGQLSTVPNVATTFDGDVVSSPTIHKVMTTKYLMTSAPNEATARRIARELKGSPGVH